MNNEPAGGRFADDNPLGPTMRRMFGGEDLLAAMKKFGAEVKAQGLTPVEVAIRWVVHHSALGDDDGVVVGASRSAQVVDTVELVRKGPLPREVLGLVEELWEGVRGTRGEML